MISGGGSIELPRNGNIPVQPNINKPNNYKTVPCRLFHSPIGCTRGDNCHFIHDYNFAGVETPNMNKYVRPFNMLSKQKDGMKTGPDGGNVNGFGEGNEGGFQNEVNIPSFPPQHTHKILPLGGKVQMNMRPPPVVG